MKKPNLLHLAITGAAAFAAGWFLKPAPSPAPEHSPSAPAETRKTGPASTRMVIEESHDPLLEPALPEPKGQAGGPIRMEQGDEATASRDNAKLLRLTEALGLSKEQQESLVQAIAGALAAAGMSEGSPVDPFKILERAAAAGSGIEKAMDSILTPEQAAEFRKLRERSLANQIEAAAQKEFSVFTGQIDLTEEQRQKALTLVKSSVEERYAARPPGLDLALESSVVPIGPTGINPDSMDSLQYVMDSKGDPAAAQAAMLQRQRAELDRQVTQYEAILTPAQMEQFRASIDERKRAIDRLSRLPR